MSDPETLEESDQLKPDKVAAVSSYGQTRSESYSRSSKRVACRSNPDSNGSLCGQPPSWWVSGVSGGVFSDRNEPMSRVSG